MIEAIVAMAVASTMLGVGIGLIHLVLRADRNATKTARYNQSLSRLSHLVRRDVHAAASVTMFPADAESQARLELRLPVARTISYAIDQATITRIESKESNSRHRDVFYFPPASAIEFGRTKKNGDDKPDIVRVTIIYPHGLPPATGAEHELDNKPTDARRVFQIEALVARDRRFEKEP